MGKQKHDRKQKNQLIPKALDEKRPRWIGLIWVLGFLLLIVSGVWALGLCRRISPPLAWLLRPPEEMSYREILEHHSHFGHAMLAPLELATLGTIILSFVHVVHQLKAQRHTERTRFQPVVTCIALLDYSVEGIMEEKKKVTIKDPMVKLRIRNLGDSPATFIDINIKSFNFIEAGGVKFSWLDNLKVKYIHIDSLGKDGVGPDDARYEAKLALNEDRKSENEVINKKLAEFVNGLLYSGDSHPGSIELTVGIQHQNVMELGYEAEGKFRWSQELNHSEKSDQEQIEYIKRFRRARASDGRMRASDERESTTIGQFIKHSEPLLAALEPDGVIRGRWLRKTLGNLEGYGAKLMKLAKKAGKTFIDGVTTASKVSR